MNSSLEKFYQYCSQILSLEKSEIKVDKEAPLSIALVFPNSYEVAMANLGFQTMYRLFNSYQDVRCERAFFYQSFPGISRTLESATKLNRFDVIAFSTSFELDYINLIKILIATGLNPFSKDRHPRDPLVMMGGTATFINPEPIAPFIDLFFIGEVEPSLDILIEEFKLLKTKNNAKQAVLKKLSDYEGIYVPSLFDQTKKIKSVAFKIKTVKPQFSSIVTPQSHFQNMFLVEVGRGCGRYCRFCAASHVYHPVRFFSIENILNTIEEHIHDTSRVGLVGAALCDYPMLLDLCKILISKNYQLGLSSFRFDAISEEFLAVMQQTGIKTITLAPEAGTERLRRIINKPISDAQIIHSIELIAKSNITNLKLYYLIGLPFENESDVLGIIDSVKQIKEIFFSHAKRRKYLTVSVNAFIPKPFTPFQWCAMDSEKNLKRKRQLIENELRKIPAIKLSKKNIREEILQGIISLGNKTLATDLLSIAASQYPIKLSSTNVFEQKDYHDILPWDFIEYRVSKQRLWKEYQKAKEIAESENSVIGQSWVGKLS